MKSRQAWMLMGVAVAGLVLLLARREPAVSAPAAATPRLALLVRFAVDGKADADWSGNVRPAPERLSGWQFDPRDEAGTDRWKCRSRQEDYWDTPYESSMKGTSRRQKVTEKGVLLEYGAGRGAKVEISTAQGGFTVDSAGLGWDAPRSYLDGRVEVRAMAPVEQLTRGPDADDYPALLEAKDGTLWLAWQSYSIDGDQLWVRRRVAGRWSQPEPVAEAGGDYFRTALAQDAEGKVWVVWSAQREGNFDLYGRCWDGKGWRAAERLTRAAGPDIYHALGADASGALTLVWQSARDGNFDIYARRYEKGAWGEELRVSSSDANDWQPAVAAAPGGGVAILWDTYDRGNYDVVMRMLQGGKLGEVTPVASSGAFEARVSAQYDRQGRLWMAWEEGDGNWGKDYGQEIIESGRGLLVRRRTRVAVIEGGQLREPGADLAAALPEEYRQVFLQPVLLLDGQDMPYLLFRTRLNAPGSGGGTDTYRAMWRGAVTRLKDNRWTPPLEFPEGFGRQDESMAAAALREGGVAVVWSTDTRQWPKSFPQLQELMAADLAGGPAGAPVRLEAFRPNTEKLPPSHANERGDVERVRAWRAKAGGKEYRIVRGDVHRHTDLSWDGNRDGSLHDSYRYALDAALMDYTGVTDHSDTTIIPYIWWMTEKAVDLFTIPGRFAPLYSYERSLSWPNGHRNVLFDKRGRPVFTPGEEERKGKEGAAKLYEYLRRHGGITSSHTSATGAGTDFRDSNEELEPVVEIYQGYRRSYERPDGPRSPKGAEASKYAEGFVWKAWEKGIKLGVQSSSDHVSTHISYACFLVDRLDRTAILDAARARRSYAATDNLILDVRMGSHFMGESFETSTPEPLQAYVHGTAPIAVMELIRNNRIIYTAPGNGPEIRFTFTDRGASPGEYFYYVRVQQKDGQLAWSSPIWVRYR